jgi:hypothetical protein
MKYHRQLMNAILNDKINIAKAVNAEDKSERCTKMLFKW